MIGDRSHSASSTTFVVSDSMQAIELWCMASDREWSPGMRLVTSFADARACDVRRGDTVEVVSACSADTDLAAFYLRARLELTAGAA